MTKNKIRNIIWTIMGFLLLVIIVHATSTITDNLITTTGNITADNYFGSGAYLHNVNFTE